MGEQTIPKPREFSKKEMYLNLCNKIEGIIKEDNPCDFIDGRCIVARTHTEFKFNSCCRKCGKQNESGCTIKSLGCKLYFCNLAEARLSEINLRVLQVIKNMSKMSEFTALLGEQF